MRIEIRPANLAEDGALLVAFLRDHLTRQSDESRFEWLYRKNPSGQALAWIVWEGISSKPIAVAAAFPRWMYVDGELLQCHVLGDFCIHPAYRSLGPALQLQRACLAAGQSGQIPLVYDFPSQAMMAIYKRLGVAASGQMVRFLKPLRIDRKVKRVMGEGALAQGIGAVGNHFLALKSFSHRSRDCDVSMHDDAFGEEFTELDRRLAAPRFVRLSRTANYLNWRYRKNPLQKYQVVTARQSGRLQAFAVLGIEGQDAILVDVLGDLETPELGEFLAGVIGLLRKTQVQTIQAPALEGSALGSQLLRAGFYARERKPMVACAQEGSRPAQLVANPANWWLTHGDRDV